MLDSLKKVREPAAWAVMVIIVGFMVLNAARLVFVLTRGEVPVFAAFADIANDSTNLTLVAALVALVCLCLFIAPASPRSTTIARWAAIIVTVGTVLTIVATLLGLWASNGVLGVIFELLGGLLDITLKAGAAFALWTIYRAVEAGRMQTPAAEPVVEAPRAITDDAPPVWRAAEASGSVWKTAADAASGAGPARPSDAPDVPTRAVEAPTDAPYTPAGAWAANPRTKQGAAEAMGWRRIGGGSSTTSEPEA